MDELEISGKRYISTRRAAKQYKYHSDYIGQLIRGKKLIGRKVGRSWYVELDSLTSYFGAGGVSVELSDIVAKTVVADVAPEVVEKEIPVAEEVPDVSTTVVVQEMVQEKKVEIVQIKNYEAEKEIETEVPVRDSIHIPIRIERPSFGGTHVKASPALTYLSDEEPYIPTAQKASRASFATTTVMPRTNEEAEAFIAKADDVPKKVHNTKIFMPVFRIAIAGVVVLSLVVGSSLFVSSSIVIEAGKAASVGLSLQ